VASVGLFDVCVKGVRVVESQSPRVLPCKLNECQHVLAQQRPDLCVREHWLQLHWSWSMWMLRGLLVLIGEFVACMCEWVRPLSKLCAELWTGLAALLSLPVLGWSLSLCHWQLLAAPVC
jgi:hypothetical protein